jgi:peptide/nickel transport system substrate-binding protein
MEGRYTRRRLLKSSGGAALAAGLAGVPVVAAESAAAAPASDEATPRRGGTLEVSITDTSTTDRLDPSMPLNTNDIISQNLIYDGLLATDANFAIHPGLASSWSSNAKGTVWQFKLRDAEFHDGTPVTADDVVWNLRRAVDPKGQGTALPQFTPSMTPGGIKAVGKKTVRIELKIPNFFLPNLLAGFYTLIAKKGTNFKNPVGSGPFTVETFKPGSLFEAARNPNYWKPGFPYLDGVRLVAVPDQATKVQTVINGTAHVGDSTEPKFVAQVLNSGTSAVVSARGGAVPMFVFQGDKKPFTDQRVLQALKLLVDRQKMASTVYFGHAIPSADIPIPVTDPYYPKGIRPLQRDPERAKALLKAAGYSDLTLNIFTAQLFPGLTDLPVLYKEMAKAGGVKVNVKNTPVQTYISSIVLKRPAFMDVWTRQHTMALVPLLYTAGSPYNETHFANAKVGQLFALAAAQKSVAKQKALIADAAELIQKECSQIIPVTQDLIWIRKKNVRGVQVNWSSFVSVRNAWLT